MQRSIHLALIVLLFACGSPNSPQRSPSNAARPVGEKRGEYFKKPFSVVMAPYALEFDVAVDGSVTYGRTGAGSPRQPGGSFDGPDRYVSSTRPGHRLVIEAHKDTITFNGEATGYHLGTDGAVTDASRRIVARLDAGKLVSETQAAGCVTSDADPHDARSAMLLILALFADSGSTSVTLC